MEENIYICPDCGTPLVKDYIDGEGRQIWHCPVGDEEYYFETKNGYLYCVCVWDKKRTCYGVSNE